jgi:ornithine cyclodeaminase
MKVLIANQDETIQLLPMGLCIETMENALRLLDAGDAVMPLRQRMALPGSRNLMGIMPSYLGGIGSLGVKVITIFPGNHGTEYDSHQGVVLLFDAQHGLLRAIVDGSAVTAIRTAAVSAIATKHLARPDARDLAIIGSGTQARTHLEAMLAVRDIRRIRVFSPTQANAIAFAAWASDTLGRSVKVAAAAREAVDGADIICTATTSQTPVVLGDWIAPGTHINAVGAYQPHARELDTAAVAGARLYVDRLESALNEAGEFILPRDEGAIGRDHIIGELGALLSGKIPGRQSPRDITLFKSLGIAVEDLAAARCILDLAVEKKIGTFVEMGGRKPVGQESIE